jgi:hypothetical protein
MYRSNVCGLTKASDDDLELTEEMEDVKKAAGVRRIAGAVVAMLAMWKLAVASASASDLGAAYAPPAGLAVPVALISTVDSATCNVGDRFEFETTSDVTLGTLVVPKGTRGHGRVASYTRADAKHDGTIGIQVDSLDLDDGRVVWVDLDPKTPIAGQLADRRHRLELFAVATQFSGNMILAPGTAFRVVTIPPRKHPAELASST